MILVVDYDPSWPTTFGALRDRYARALAGIPVVAIEHVGSTAVPELAAKPVIDIDIVVTPSQVAAASSVLEGLGFASLGEMGIPQRWAFRAPTDAPRTNTYVVEDGSLGLRNHLGVRDVLRGDPVLRDEYAALKRRLVAATDDIADYGEAKSALLERVLRQAGISDVERGAVEEANRSHRTGL